MSLEVLFDDTQYLVNWHMRCVLFWDIVHHTMVITDQILHIIEQYL